MKCFLVLAVGNKQQQTANKERTNRMIKLFNQTIGHQILGLLLGTLVTTGMATYGSDTPSSTTWYSGQRAFGQVTVEPAVDLATGDEIFLLTPNNAPLPSKAAQRAHAPLYLVLYPDTSTIRASSLNCTPTNCGHLQSWPAYPLLGHDHLVGVPHTGDFNVVWDVILVSFTTQGLGDSAIDTRILTLAQLDAAVAAGDVVKSDVVLSFNCSITSITTYLHGTPLSFTVP
jgi:hypothetical protein